MGIIDQFKNLSGQTKLLLAGGTLLALFVALPLFIFAVTTQNFEIRNRAQEVIPTPTETPLETVSPSPTESPTESPSSSPSGSPDATVSPSPIACNISDINIDGITDLTDYSILVANFFMAPPSVTRTDINGDGIVDITDYSLLVADFFNLTGACQ